ncbi:putative CYTH domain protein [Campylobacter iguaniorum]|uniref:hypothetical protein n=1 Tax=Campylobacter iguaniorum TaxID=1244531 RepID=UPI0007C92F1A|nr:hypothetical protein [Campylobacter iguaniorum]ANE35308.1 putative CYTH domain protein [Campylobacter iguaniorum]
MVLEIERKFLLNDTFLQNTLQTDGVEFKQLNITQFYTQISPVNETRYRKSDDEFFKTTKFGKGLIRQEHEIKISKQEYEKALKHAIALPISKTRYEFKLNNLPCNIDVYSDWLCDLAVFEIEFLTQNDAKEFVMPEFLAQNILKEITEDERYKNKNLALFGNPNFNFDYKNSLKMIEKLGEFKLFFPSLISTYDGIRMVLFQIYNTILSQKLNYLKTKDKASLQSLQNEIYKSLFFLKSFKFAIDERICTKFINIFEEISQKMLNLIEQNFLEEYIEAWQTSSNQANNFYQNRQILEDEIRLFLSSDEFEEILKEWEILLSDSDGFYISKYGQNCLKSSVAYHLRLLCLGVLKSFYSMNNYANLYKNLLNLKITLEYFGDIFVLKTDKLVKKIDKVLKEINFILQSNNFAKMKFDSDKFSTFDKNIKKQNNKIQKKIQTKMQKINGKIHKLSRILKVYYTKEI